MGKERVQVIMVPTMPNQILKCREVKRSFLREIPNKTRKKLEHDELVSFFVFLKVDSPVSQVHGQ